MAQYTEIVLAYVESARASTKSPQAYFESARATAKSAQAATESARAAVKAARTTQAEITKMMEGEDSPWWSWTFTSEQLVHCLHVIFMTDACELNF